MNHATWTRSLLAISLALNLGVVAALVLRQPPPADPPAAAHEAPVNLQDYLELTGEQRQHWQQLEPGFLTEVSANWNAIRKHREALVRHIFAAAPDRQAIDAEQAAIARLQAEQQQRVIAQLLAERALLNEAQRVRLMELLLRRYAQESSEEELLHRE
ncbi:MAG TPA: periplasmic heavy metal sensor [Giesbergeria sp.]|jgi:Spy/CpxP family protein refolding chaperone|uniref:Spy/CpxP family protein refolding chaperone n=1 Tax=Acidovorax sp. 210-6 TaxID=2699468 RepID=UPI001389CBF2|nr:periplasmic heavy metal sensor [Acidovorax sp. 210-6]NCU65232.1 periplasmic heavy metal sensor [Acidovorax sp. 210-6]HNN88078.1 periplasmic heavy metal sensor [Giesbergeria sp.]